jgi:hypothetical protein
MLGVVVGYGEKLRKKDPETPFLEWLKASTTISDVRDLLARMHKARQEVNVQDLIDPATALVAASCGFVETNLMNALGYPKHEIVATIDEVYLPWLDSIMDMSRPTSAGGYAKAAGERLKDWNAKAAANPVGAPTGMVVGSSALVACTGVNDYLPEETKEVQDCPLPREARSWNPAEGYEEKSQSRPKIEMLVLNCTYEDVLVHAEHVGPNDRLSLSSSFLETEVLDSNGEGTGVLELSTSLSEVHTTAGAASLPADNLCEVVTAYVPNEGVRVDRMKAMGRRTQGDTNYNQLLQIIEQINLERGRASFGAQAIVACQAARDNLVALRGAYL